MMRPNPPTPPPRQEEAPRRPWEYMLLLLALPLSFSCVFCSATGALQYWPDKLAPASLLSQRRADYGGGPGGPVFPVLQAGAQFSLATQIARLQVTPAQPGRPAAVVTIESPPWPTATPRPGDPSDPTAGPTESATGSGPAAKPPNPAQTTAQVPPLPAGPALPPGTISPPPVPSIPPTTPLPSASPPPTLALPTFTPVPTVPPVPTSTPIPPAPLPTLTPRPPAATSTSTATPTFTPTPWPDDDDSDHKPRPATATPLPRLPVAIDDAVTLSEDTPALIAVLANDLPGDQPLLPGSVGVATPPQSGTTLVDPVTGQVSYTPALNFFGSDSFSYRVCGKSGGCDTATVSVTVWPVNDPPLAVADAAYTAEDTVEDIEVLLNDLDVESDPLTVTLITQPGHGSATTDGRVVSYQPASNFFGPDSLTYTVSDGLLTSTGLVSITTVAVNDPPLAYPDSYTTTSGITLTVTATTGLLANDLDADVGDTLTAVKVSDPLTGTLTLAADGSFTYLPAPAGSGVVTFTYQAKDSLDFLSNLVTVTVTILSNG